MTSAKNPLSGGDAFDPLDSRAVFLLSQIGHHLASRFAEELRPLSISPRHFALLDVLASADGQTQQQLADQLSIHRNVMVGLVDDLERLRLATREPYAEDRRAHAVRLTPLGRKAARSGHGVADALEAELLASIPTAEARRLVQQLQRLALGLGLERNRHPSLRAER